MADLILILIDLKLSPLLVDDGVLFAVWKKKPVLGETRFLGNSVFGGTQFFGTLSFWGIKHNSVFGE